MVREALRERFVQALTDAGGSAGNGRLLSELGWQEDTYQSVRDALLEERIVVLGRGRGGSVKLASQAAEAPQPSSPKAPAAVAPSRAEKINAAKVNGGAAQPRSGRLTQAELDRHLWQAADILRGHVDAGDYKQYVFGLLFYKRLCDVWDEEFETLLAETGDREEAADPDEHRFDIPTEHRWEEVRKHSTQIGQRLNNAFAAIEDANLRLRGVFGSVDFANQERFPDPRLERLLAHFEKHRLRNADVTADVLGDAYMYLIKMFAEGSGKKGGEFYTPRQVVRLIVDCLQPAPGMSIYDPTCGSGGMLLEAVQFLKENGEDARSLSLYGQEKNLGTWAIAEMNLFLHDIDDAFIAKGDTLASPKRYDPKASEFVEGVGAYDRVMANPPFSEKVWGYEVWANGDPFGRDAYGCPPKGYGDLAFVQHMIASLKADGMLGVVVPHGVLFRGGAEGRIREAMLKADIVEAVIGLAPNLFYGAGIPAAILIVSKSKPAERKGKVLIVNGDATFQPGKAQNTLTDANLKMLADTFHDYKDVEKLARVVPVEELAREGYDLNVGRYVQVTSNSKPAALPSELAKLRDLLDVQRAAEERMSFCLRSAEAHARAADEVISVSSVVGILSGFAFKSEDFTDDINEGMPLIRIRDLRRGATACRCKGDFDQRYIVRAGDIVIGMDGEFTAVKWAGDDALLNQRVMRVWSEREDILDATYLFYRIQPDLRRLEEQITGTTVKHLSVKDIRKLEWKLPPLKQQEEIASLLSSLDDLATASRQVSEQCSAKRDTLISHHLLGSS